MRDETECRGALRGADPVAVSLFNYSTITAHSRSRHTEQTNGSKQPETQTQNTAANPVSLHFRHVLSQPFSLWPSNKQLLITGSDSWSCSVPCITHGHSVCFAWCKAATSLINKTNHFVIGILILINMNKPDYLVVTRKQAFIKTNE